MEALLQKPARYKAMYAIGLPRKRIYQQRGRSCEGAQKAESSLTWTLVNIAGIDSCALDQDSKQLVADALCFGTYVDTACATA